MTSEHQRIEDIATCRRNLDSMSRDDAARNLIDGKPAYWSLAEGSALGLSAQIAASANFHASLVEALAEKADSFAHRRIDVARHILDKLIPLNIDAVEELDMAFRRLATFRTRYDLLIRETRAICNPWSPVRPNDDSEALAAKYAELCTAAQARFRARANAATDAALVEMAKPLRSARVA